jgi:metallo-beta-lactamase class B
MVNSKRRRIRDSRGPKLSWTLFRAVLFVSLMVSTLPGFAQGGERGADGRRISEKVTPFKIVGNIYYVGGTDMTVFLITTPEGHILIDSTYERDAPWIRQNVEELGFNMRDITLLLNSHAHADHIEAHSLMKEMTGAQVVMSEADGASLAEGGGIGPDGRPRFDPVRPDRLIRTGDTVTLGGTTLTAHVFPGHTRGATTWTTVVGDGGQRRTFTFWGGIGGVRQPFVNNTEWPSIAEDYADTLRRARQLSCEFFTEGHAEGFGLINKMNRLLEGEQPNPFYAPQECRESLEQRERDFQAQLARERTEAGR